jgi:hypothetical protein
MDREKLVGARAQGYKRAWDSINDYSGVEGYVG